LANERWPVVINHGDFAPWNLILDGNVARAVDWEEGCMEGFPHLDLCHYLLQTAALVYRWSAGRTLRYVVKYLREQPWPKLGRHAHNLVRITALHDYCHALDMGVGTEEPFQSWRRRLWEMELA